MIFKRMGKFQRCIAVLGIGITLYAADYWLRSNFNIGNLLVLALGLVLVFWFIVPEIRLIIWLKRLVLLGFAVYFVMAAFIFVKGKAETADFKEDAVIVLGCGVKGTRLSLNLRERLLTAYEYYEKNPGCVICVTGGQGPQEDITEAEAMEAYLLELGIPEEKTIKETEASSTEENFAFSKTLLDDYFGEDTYSVVYITNDFHSYRAGIDAERAGFSEVHAYPAPSSLRSLLPNYMREVLAVLYKRAFG